MPRMPRFSPTERFRRRFDETEPYTKYTALAKRQQKGGFSSSLHGHFGRQRGLPDAHQTRKAILLFTAIDPPAALLVLARDSDTDPNRRRGFDQAWRQHGKPTNVCARADEPGG